MISPIEYIHTPLFPPLGYVAKLVEGGFVLGKYGFFERFEFGFQLTESLGNIDVFKYSAGDYKHEHYDCDDDSFHLTSSLSVTLGLFVVGVSDVII